METSKSSSAQPTADLEQHQIHGESFLHWSDEGTGEEKLSNSTQQSLYKGQLQGISLKKQDILRVYSVVTTRIGKSPNPPSEFQLQPNEEPTQHAPRQVLIHTQELPGNQCSVLPVKEVIECESSLEIVDEEVPADFKVPAYFNTETKDHSPQKKMTGRLESFLGSFLDSFGIVDTVPVDFNTGKDHLQDPDDLQPNSSGSMESDAESYRIQ